MLLKRNTDKQEKHRSRKEASVRRFFFLGACIFMLVSTEIKENHESGVKGGNREYCYYNQEYESPQFPVCTAILKC